MDVFDLYAKIGLDKSEYESGLKDAKGSMSGFASSVGNGLKTVAKVGAKAIAAGAAGVAALTKMGVEGYKQYEQLAGGAELMWGDAYKFISQQASNAYKNVQMSQNDYLQQVNGFAVGLKTALGGNEQAAAELADRIITAEADIVAATGNSQEMVQNAFNGIMKNNFSMIDNLGLGVTATKEGFQAMIDSVNAYNAEHGKSTQYQIDNVADCQAALLDYIEMQGMSGYAGMEAAKTIEGSLSMMKSAWQNLVVGMADENANMDVLINNLVDSTTTALGNIMPRVEQTLAGIGQLVEGLAPVIGNALPGLVSSVLPSLLNAAVGLVNSVISAFPGLMDMLVTSVIPPLISGIVTAFNAVVAMLPTLIESLVSALPGLIPQLVSGLVSMAVTLCTMAAQIIKPIIDYLPDILISICDALLSNLDVLIQGLIDLVVAVIPMLPQIILALLEAAPMIITMVTEALIDAVPILLAGLLQICVTLATELINYWKALPGKLLEIAGSLISSLGELFSPLAEWFNTNVIQPVANFFADLWQGVCDGVTAAWEWICGVFKPVGAWIYDNVISPVADFFKGLWEGIVNAWHTVIDPWIEIVKRLASMFYDSVIKPVADFFVNLWNGIKEGATAAWNGIKNVFSVVANWFNSTIITPVKNFFTGMWDGLKNGAKNAWNGITSVFSNVTNWFKDKFSAAWQAVKNVFSTGGKVFDGIKEGIVSVFKTVVNAIIGGINKVIKVPFDAINNVLKRIKSIEIVGIKPFNWVTTFSVPQIPKLSTGLNFVPYDEYPAFLHRGEAVLTAAQARAWRNGHGETALPGGNGQIVSLLVAILNAITGGNEEMIQAILSDRMFVVGEREFARAVKQYA